LFREPKELPTAGVAAIAVARAHYTLTVGGTLASHNHGETFVIGELGDLSKARSIKLSANVFALNGARELVCAQIDDGARCFQYSISFPQNYAVEQMSIPGPFERLVVGPSIAVQRSGGRIDFLNSWPDKWRERSSWLLFNDLNGNEPLDPAPLRRQGPARLVESESGIEVVVNDKAFECHFRTVVVNPTFQCRPWSVQAPDAVEVVGQYTLVPGRAAGRFDLVGRAPPNGEIGPLVRDVMAAVDRGGALQFLTATGEVRFANVEALWSRE